jgi:hypothetical protein
MRESFDEYKSTIETNVMNITYLYDGDVISSVNGSYSEILSHNRSSTLPIVNCISDIYNKSIYSMMNKSVEKNISIRDIDKLDVVPSNTDDNIFYYIDKLKDNNFNPLYVFCSENSRKLFGITRNNISNRPFPSYFYDIHKYHSQNYSLYICPLLRDNENESHVYVTNKSIQSLVYSIQNMDYVVEDFGNGSYKHTIHYKLYDCDFTCYKLNIKSISRLREDKINKLLSEN